MEPPALPPPRRQAVDPRRGAQGGGSAAARRPVLSAPPALPAAAASAKRRSTPPTPRSSPRGRVRRVGRRRRSGRLAHNFQQMRVDLYSMRTHLVSCRRWPASARTRHRSHHQQRLWLLARSHSGSRRRHASFRRWPACSAQPPLPPLRCGISHEQARWWWSRVYLWLRGRSPRWPSRSRRPQRAATTTVSGPCLRTSWNCKPKPPH